MARYILAHGRHRAEVCVDTCHPTARTGDVIDNMLQVSECHGLRCRHEHVDTARCRKLIPLRRSLAGAEQEHNEVFWKAKGHPKGEHGQVTNQVDNGQGKHCQSRFIWQFHFAAQSWCGISDPYEMTKRPLRRAAAFIG